VLIGTMSIQLSRDNHDSWGTCTTFAECKTIIAIMHTVMSGMDPHMISETWDGFCLSFWLGHVEVGFTRLWVGHGETPWHNQDHYL
jgi:hypothetical protein